MNFSLSRQTLLLKPQSLLAIVLSLAVSSSFCAQSPTATEAIPTSTLSAHTPPESRVDPLAPMIVGPRELVGKPGLAEKAAASAVGGLVGSVLGGSGRQQAQPKTHRDPSRKVDYNNLAAENFDTETRARGLWTEEGLLISSRIEDSPGKGTFQTVFLESCDGRRLYPHHVEIYDLWKESSLSVSWSKASTSNGQVTSQESGSWENSWSEDFSSIKQQVGDSAVIPGAWQSLGFDRAQGGARQIGAYFNLTPEQLASMGEVGLFVHTTRPTQDPVTTTAAHWLLGPGTVNQPLLTAPTDSAGNAGNAWQSASRVCSEQGPALVASAAALSVTAASAAANPTASHAGTIAGLPIPAGLELVTAKGTGRTTGHIANLDLRNNSDSPLAMPDVGFFIPSDGKYQSYVGKIAGSPAIPAGTTQTIPVTGYCADVRQPPVPAGDDMPPPENWIVASGQVEPAHIPALAGAAEPGRALIPGTDNPLPRAISQDDEPLVAAPLLVSALAEIERKTDELQQSGALQTPYSGNPEREREAVIQQTFWIYAAELEGEPYNKEEFTERLEQQYEDRSGIAITAAPPEDQQRVQQGADDFWDSFELVGVEAKVLGAADATPPGAGTTKPNETKAATAPGEQPPAAGKVAADPCPSDKHIHHTDKKVEVKVADSYGDEESRKKITDGIEKSVASDESAYVTSTPPSTAYSIWRDDHIGGISSAYAKSVFLEENDQEWVWSTDPLKTTAKGTGTHRLSFKPGPECKAWVAGAALMWVKSSSEAFDPLERSIEVFRALDAVKELSVKYVTRKLPPGLDEAIEAGVEAITDPASDTYAAASGNVTLIVGDKKDQGEAANRVVYKRKDKEDKAIIGGGATIKKLFASDVKPNSLTSKIDGIAVMEAGATGNGFAKAYLESVYGTLLVGVCECPNSPASFEILSDVSLFLRSSAVEGEVTVAKGDMEKAVDRIRRDIVSGAQDMDGEELKKRIEAELKAWGEGMAGERFKPEEPKAASK